MRHVLVVDDERDAAETMALLVSDAGFTVATAASLVDARRQMAMHKPDLVLLDLVLPDGSGMDLFDHGCIEPDTEVVLVTGHGDMESSIQAIRRGASDYLLKPVGKEELQGVLDRLARPYTRLDSGSGLSARRAVQPCAHRLLGRSKGMRRVREQIERVASTGATVLLTGESGSGKEIVATTVHQMSRRRDRPMLTVNCGAISANLMESEIFGHEKGSFTGADVQHIGFFERAQGGTLFLDEITEMPLELQVKLLQVLESGSFMRVGSTQPQTTDIRLIAATNRDPLQAVRDGKLREDLLYRLNVFPIHVPPLRERLDDVPLLAEHFLDAISRRERRTKCFVPTALERLKSYSWPGNVRELRNVVERAYVMAAGSQIIDACLPVRSPLPGREKPAAPDAPTLSVCVGKRWDDIERQVMLATLHHFGGHHQRTSYALGVSVKTLYNRLKAWSAPSEVAVQSVTLAAQRTSQSDMASQA